MDATDTTDAVDFHPLAALVREYLESEGCDCCEDYNTHRPLRARLCQAVGIPNPDYSNIPLVGREVHHFHDNGEGRGICALCGRLKVSIPDRRKGLTVSPWHDMG